MLAPFQQPDFGPHARYLLARTHHLADEKAEAALHYEGAIADYAKSKALAVELLKVPQKFKNDPTEKARLEALVKDPVPDHVARATFYLGVLLYEGGKFADAKARFAEFPKLYPQSPLRTEADIRIGFCQVQLKEFAEAVKTLAPLVDKDARLSDQVFFWLGKAQAGAAPDAAMNLAGYQQALNAAINTYRQASRARPAHPGPGPEAKVRRAEILLEMADTHAGHQAAQGGGRASTSKSSTRKPSPTAMRRSASDWSTPCTWPATTTSRTRRLPASSRNTRKSPLLPAVLFSQAENSYFRGLAAEKNPNQAERAKEIARLSDEAIKRYADHHREVPRVPQDQPGPLQPRPDVLPPGRPRKGPQGPRRPSRWPIAAASWPSCPT